MTAAEAGAPGRTVRDALARAVARLAAAGVPEPRADAEVLLAHALGTMRAGLVVRAREALADGVAARVDALVERRAVERVPVAHLVGVRDFWSMDVAVDGRVLVPRPETEGVVELALRLGPGARRVVDVGTGSGCIAAALARELPDAVVVAVERDAGALAVARANLARLAPHVGLVRGDLLAAVGDARVDLVVSNPPYVPTADIARLAPEVRDHEPHVALDGGPDGLDVLTTLLAEAPRVLRGGGWLLMEMGVGQAPAMRARAAADGRWDRVVVADDLAGIPRVLAVRRSGGGRWT